VRLRDITDGAQSLGELDFAQMCRRHGIPPPDRQVLRRTARGRVYLDARWAGRRLVVEIDGAGHRVGLAVTDDNLRQNEVALGDTGCCASTSSVCGCTRWPSCSRSAEP